MPRAFLFGLVSSLGLLVFACGKTDPEGEKPIELPDDRPKEDASTNPPGPTCTAPKSACGQECVDLATDPKNCGGCGTACNGGEVCVASKCAKVSTFAVKTIFLGETDRAGVKKSDAWKAYGENLDGLVSTNIANGECKLMAGAPSSVRTDGDNGIDNTWGKEILKLLDPFLPTPSATSSGRIFLGGRTPLIGITGGVPTGDASGLAATFTYAEQTTSPVWDGKDARKIAEAWTTAGVPTASFAAAKVTGGVFESGILPGSALFAFTIGQAEVEVPIQKLRIRMKLGDTGATEGMMSGVMLTADLEAGIAKAAAFLSKDLCSGSTIEGIKQSVRQASDSLQDGTQDPNMDCNAISIGIGFDAVPVIATGIAPKPAPPADPCQ